MTPSKMQIANAFKAAKALRICTDEIRPVIRHLYKVFPKNWEHVEADNYRVLFDTYFEMKENKVVSIDYFLFFIFAFVYVSFAKEL